jgi:Ca2+-binding RTX toxin-like protein
MTTTLAFNGGVSVNMTNVTTLYTQNVLANFAAPGTGGLIYGPVMGDGTSQPLMLQNHPAEDQVASEVRLWGHDFAYTNNGDGEEISAGSVTRIEIFAPQDFVDYVDANGQPVNGYSNPSHYRVAILFDHDRDMATVINDAMLQLDPSALYANDDLLIFGDVLRDTLVGGAHSDDISGGGGPDRLLGMAGADVLRGQAGDDTLIGGTGKDILRGGAGADRFVFASDRGVNSELIKDFSHSQGDKLALDNSVLAGLGADGKLAAWKFIAATDIGSDSGGTGVNSGDRILYDTDSGKLYYDANGSGAGGRVFLGNIAETGGDHPTLVVGDFRVI